MICVYRQKYKVINSRTIGNSEGAASAQLESYKDQVLAMTTIGSSYLKPILVQRPWFPPKHAG
jgi:hypothetical protein